MNAAPIIPLRYMIAFIYPITATIRPFLEKKGHTKEEVDRMHDAWFKSVVLHVVLWSRPYTPDSGLLRLRSSISSCAVLPQSSVGGRRVTCSRARVLA